SLPVTERCTLDATAAKAVDYYVSYWDDLVGFEDFVGESLEEAFVNVEVRTFGAAGSTVGVDVGGDEDFVIFVFDASGELLLYFHDEQSSTFEFVCDEVAVDAVDEDCVARTVYDLPHKE